MATPSEPDLDELLQKGIRAARRGHQEPARRLLGQVLQADPNREEAWVWLARVVDNPTQRAECLKQALRLNPGNAWAAGELAALHAPTPLGDPSKVPPPGGLGEPGEVGPAQVPPPGRLGGPSEVGPAQVPPSGGLGGPSEVGPAQVPPPGGLGGPSEVGPAQVPPSGGLGGPAGLSLEALACPQCSGALDLKSGAEAKTLVCGFCGSVLDLTGEQAAIVGQANRRLKPEQPISLGMEGTFDGERHQVIGWVRYEGWDDEDRWRWDEWLLASAGGQFRWLSYDPEEGFILQHKVQPAGPFDPQTATTIPTPTGSARVAERAPAKLLALEGELTWRAAVGDRITYIEARQGPLRYSVEVTDQELELLEGRGLSEAEVWTAFGRQDLLQQAAGREQWKTGYKILALACALLAFLGCLGAVFTTATGQAIFDGQVQLAQGEAGAQSVGPVVITQPGRVHQISLQAGTLPTNSWAEVEVSISGDTDSGETEAEVFLFAEEFWDEVGSDSDGPWHESDLGGSYLFRPDAAGEYYLELAMDETTVPSLPVTVTVTQGVWLSRYLVIYAAICLVLGLFFAFLGLARQLAR